jgi:hypothetical protein
VSTAITGIRAVGVPVTDQDRAVEFYGVSWGWKSGWTSRQSSSVGGGSRWRRRGRRRRSRSCPPDGVGDRADTEIRLTTVDAGSLREDLRAHSVEVDELLRWEGTRRCSPSATRTVTAWRSSSHEQGYQMADTQRERRREVAHKLDKEFTATLLKNLARGLV